MAIGHLELIFPTADTISKRVMLRIRICVLWYCHNVMGAMTQSQVDMK